MNRILVTGSHYSGTTLVGRILASHAAVRYVHEPFNIDKPPSQAPNIFRQWYSYVDEQNESQFAACLDKVIFDPGSPDLIFRNARRIRSLKDALRVGKYVVRETVRNREAGTVLVKDPIALFSSQWLANRYKMSVVLTTRHPCAFVESVKRKEAHFPFHHLMDQPELMDRLLSKYQDDIAAFATKRQSLVEQAALAWMMLNDVALRFADDDSRFMLVRLEDLVNEPLDVIQGVCRHVDLELSTDVRKAIETFLDPANPLEQASGGEQGYVQRNPSFTVNKWKHNLTEDEISFVMTHTREISERLGY